MGTFQCNNNFMTNRKKRGGEAHCLRVPMAYIHINIHIYKKKSGSEILTRSFIINLKNWGFLSFSLVCFLISKIETFLFKTLLMIYNMNAINLNI